MFSFKKKEALVTCYSYHFFNNVFDSRKIALALFEYFKMKSVVFQYFSGFDEKYRNYSGKIQRLFSLSAEKWQTLNNVYLYPQENFDSTKIFLNYNMQPPVSLFLAFHMDFDFSMKELFLMLPKAKLCYGYRYDCSAIGLSETYSIGGIENRKRIVNLPQKRLSEKVIFKWRKNHDMILEGYLRDIYLENILTNDQLNQSIGNVSLQEVIHSNNWGTIDQLSDNANYWRIEEAQLLEVQKRLYNTNILL